MAQKEDDDDRAAAALFQNQEYYGYQSTGTVSTKEMTRVRSGSSSGRSRSGSRIGSRELPREVSRDALLINSTQTLSNSQYLGEGKGRYGMDAPLLGGPPTQGNSPAVRAYQQSIRKQHYMHFKMFFVIFAIVLAGIAFQAIYYYDLPPISSATANSVGASVIQGLHQLSVMITTFIALAIPLTANFYTPRLYEVFLKDRVNIMFFICFSVFSTMSVFTDAFVFASPEVDWLPYCALVMSGVFGWSVVVPYYYYVMRFLDPEVIVDRVSSVVVKEIFRTVSRKYPPALARKKLNDAIIQLGDIGFRSVDRKDSGTTITTIRALCFVLGIYREQKPFMHPKFFEVDASEFPNLSKSGLNYLSHSSLWVEEQVIVQMHKAFTSALNRMPGVVSFIALAVREQCIPLMNQPEPDALNLHLYIRFMNTFLRETINKHDVRGLFNVFYQYTSLAKDLSKWYAQDLPLVAKYMSYYMQLCSSHGLDFGAQICLYDLENLTAYLYRTKNMYASVLLGHLLAPNIKCLTGMERRGAIHSRLILGSFLMYIERLLQRDNKDAMERVARSCVRAKRSEIMSAAKQIVEVVDEMFWEITDRVVNFDFVPEQQRPYVLKFRDKILATKRDMGIEDSDDEDSDDDGHDIRCRGSDSSEEESDDDNLDEPISPFVHRGRTKSMTKKALRKKRAAMAARRKEEEDKESDRLERRNRSAERRRRQNDDAQEASSVSGAVGMMIT
mmetsp:Transcript_8417/g.35194  ORF Transcript_8417/g.35194 Transcript_8417/m.35194 type:complete len:728 (+) Transcript_8417:116-2299(+)